MRWTDRGDGPFVHPTSNLTIVHPSAISPDFESYAKFTGTVFANTGYSTIATSLHEDRPCASPPCRSALFEKIDLSEYVETDNVMDQGSIVVEAR